MTVNTSGDSTTWGREDHAHVAAVGERNGSGTREPAEKEEGRGRGGIGGAAHLLPQVLSRDVEQGRQHRVLDEAVEVHDLVGREGGDGFLREGAVGGRTPDLHPTAAAGSLGRGGNPPTGGCKPS